MTTQRYPNISPLANNQVHLWCCKPSSIEDYQLLQQYHAILNTEEKQRYQRFHFAKDRHRHLVTRALIRTTLSHYAPHIQPNAWQFDLNDFGKPSIANIITPQLQFNISHSHNFIAVAITLAQTIGMDVEKIRDRKHIDGLAEHCFTETEQAYIFAEKGKHVLKRFFQLWTLKESYIKARGKGLAIPLQELSFELPVKNDTPPLKEISIILSDKHQGDSSKWQFQTFQPSPKYQLAITAPKNSHATPMNIKMIEAIPYLTHKELDELKVNF